MPSLWRVADRRRRNRGSLTAPVSLQQQLPQELTRRIAANTRSCLNYCAGEVVAKGRGERVALVEYSRPLTRSSHLSSALRPFATLNARKAFRDLVPQTPSAGPFRNLSSISRFCAAIISLGGVFDLLVPSSGATTAVRSAWTDESATACGFAASVLVPRKKPTASITIKRIAATPGMTAAIPAIPICRCPVSLCRCPALSE